MKRHDEVRDGARLTAYALGELEGKERSEIEARLANDAEARAFVEDVRGTAKWLELGLAAEGAPVLEDAQRAAIERAARTAGLRRDALSPRRMATVGVLAAAAVALVVAGVRHFVPPPEVSINAEVGRLSAPNGGLLQSRPPAASPVAGGARAAGGTTRMLEGLGYIGSDRPALGRDARNELRRLGYVDELELEERELDSYTPFDRDAYDRIVENPFIRTTDDPRSTFSIDVDTASYANVRRYLRDGQLPPADAVRIEELVNYFPYEYAGPTNEHPFAVHVEVADAPWKPQHRLVRIALQGRDVPKLERRAANLVFLIDVSGSMNGPDRLPLLKKSLAMLVNELGDEDTVSLVVYAGAAGLVLPPTPAANKVTILDALERLQAGGSTAGGAGIELAYKTAREAFVEGGINRVILASDGDFNVGVSDTGALTRLVEERAKSGVFLTILGFGRGNLQDSKLEQLSNKGNGNYAYIDSLLEAKKVLVHELGGTLETIAKDVKIQLEFNPSQVAAHRLIGYENRMLAHQDFADDTKDAGEIGAGHTVTALYEVVPFGVPLDGLVTAPPADELRYQREATPKAHAFSGELLHVALRYKKPDGDVSTELGVPVPVGGGTFHEASVDTRFAVSVAAFGMLLRGSNHVGAATFDDVVRWASEAQGEDPGGYRAEFLALARMAGAIGAMRNLGYTGSEEPTDPPVRGPR